MNLAATREIDVNARELTKIGVGVLGGLAAELALIMVRFDVDALGMLSGLAVVAVASLVVTLVHHRHVPVKGVLADVTLFLVLCAGNSAALVALNIARGSPWGLSLPSVATFAVLVGVLFSVGPFAGTLAVRRWMN